MTEEKIEGVMCLVHGFKISWPVKPSKEEASARLAEWWTDVHAKRHDGCKAGPYREGVQFPRRPRWFATNPVRRVGHLTQTTFAELDTSEEKTALNHQLYEGRDVDDKTWTAHVYFDTEPTQEDLSKVAAIISAMAIDREHATRTRGCEP